MRTIPNDLQLPVSEGSINPRNVVASYQRDGQTKPYLVRRYARLGTAMPRVMAYLIQNGEPRDTVDFYHLETGLFIGFLRVHVGGRLTGQFLKG